MNELIVIAVCYLGVVSLMISWSRAAKIPTRYTVFYSLLWPMFFVLVGIDKILDRLSS